MPKSKNLFIEVEVNDICHNLYVTLFLEIHFFTEFFLAASTLKRCWPEIPYQEKNCVRVTLTSGNDDFLEGFSPNFMKIWSKTECEAQKNNFLIIFSQKDIKILKKWKNFVTSPIFGNRRYLWVENFQDLFLWCF